MIIALKSQNAYEEQCEGLTTVINSLETLYSVAADGARHFGNYYMEENAQFSSTLDRGFWTKTFLANITN